MPFNTPSQELLRNMPDNGVVNLQPLSLLDRVKGAYTRREFSDEDEYATALESVIDDRKEVDDIVRHEARHAFVARAVGVNYIRFTFDLDDEGNLSGVWTKFSGGTIPKIAYAAIHAAPLDYSTIDLSDIRALGYSGVDDVGARVVAWNRSDNGLHIPAPLAYTVDNL